MQNLQGKPDTRPKIHSFNQHCPIQYRVQSVLGVHSSYVGRSFTIVKYFITCEALDLVFAGEEVGENQVQFTACAIQ